MKKFAVIDVGSNSVRLLMAGGTLLYKRLKTTRLGEGLAKEPLLLPAAIERTATAVAEFYREAQAEGAEKILAFATAAVRTAHNRDEFLNRVEGLCGLKIEVVTGEMEAEIGILGALGNGDGGVIDIGGASTEIVVKQGGAISYKKSVDIGVVRLKDKCKGELSALHKETAVAAEAYAGLPTKGKFYGIGGTATTLAAQYLGLAEYDGNKVTGAKLSQSAVRALAEKFAGMTVAEIAALPCMPKGREDVVLGGAVWLSTLMERWNIPEITVSDRDNLEGYAILRGLME